MPPIMSELCFVGERQISVDEWQHRDCCVLVEIYAGSKVLLLFGIIS